MGKDFQLDNTEVEGKIIHVSHVRNREVSVTDVEWKKIKPKDFVIFYTGILGELGYPSRNYITSELVELSQEVVDRLIEKQVTYIGVDLGGIRRIADHPRIDQYCADHGVFVVENLNHLDILWKESQGKSFHISIYPLPLVNATGLPCRVIATLDNK